MKVACLTTEGSIYVSRRAACASSRRGMTSSHVRTVLRTIGLETRSIVGSSADISTVWILSEALHLPVWGDCRVLPLYSDPGAVPRVRVPVPGLMAMELPNMAGTDTCCGHVVERTALFVLFVLRQVSPFGCVAYRTSGYAPTAISRQQYSLLDRCNIRSAEAYYSKAITAWVPV